MPLWTIPEVVCSTASIDEAYDTQLKAYTNMLSSYGVDLATYAGMIGSDEDSFRQEIRQGSQGNGETVPRFK